MGCAVVLFLSLWLPWFTTSEENPNSVIAGARRRRRQRLAGFTTLDWLLALACTAPLHPLLDHRARAPAPWKPGEVTMLVGVVAFVLILCNGIILGRPGTASTSGSASATSWRWPRRPAC